MLLQYTGMPGEMYSSMTQKLQKNILVLLPLFAQEIPVPAALNHDDRAYIVPRHRRRYLTVNDLRAPKDSSLSPQYHNFRLSPVLVTQKASASIYSFQSDTHIATNISPVSVCAWDSRR